MPFHFHFTQAIDAAQIQLFATIVKCMLDDEFSMKNAQWVDCAMPQEVQNLQQFQDLCDSGQIGSNFQITTPRYECLEYVSNRRSRFHIWTPVSVCLPFSLIFMLLWLIKSNCHMWPW